MHMKTYFLTKRSHNQRTCHLFVNYDGVRTAKLLRLVLLLLSRY